MIQDEMSAARLDACKLPTMLRDWWALLAWEVAPSARLLSWWANISLWLPRLCAVDLAAVAQTLRVAKTGPPRYR